MREQGIWGASLAKSMVCRLRQNLNLLAFQDCIVPQQAVTYVLVRSWIGWGVGGIYHKGVHSAGYGAAPDVDSGWTMPRALVQAQGATAAAGPE